MEPSWGKHEPPTARCAGIPITTPHKPPGPASRASKPKATEEEETRGLLSQAMDRKEN